MWSLTVLIPYYEIHKYEHYISEFSILISIKIEKNLSINKI